MKTCRPSSFDKRNFQMEGNMRPALVLSGLCLALNLYAQSVVTYSATDVPVHIPDVNGRAESFISIEPWYVILDVNVVVTITHTYDQDLRLYLEAPDHSVVILPTSAARSATTLLTLALTTKLKSIFLRRSTSLHGKLSSLSFARCARWSIHTRTLDVSRYGQLGQ